MNLKDIERVFHFADKENRGFLQRKEIKIAYVAIFGYKPARTELDDIISNYGKHINTEHPDTVSISDLERRANVVTRNEFLSLITNRLKFADKDNEIREIFQLFDRNNKGFIDLDDFLYATKLRLKCFADFELTQFFRELDGDCDGRISYRDFQRMMRSKESCM